MRLLILISILFLSGCNSEKERIIKISGEAQGTTYQISYVNNGNEEYQAEIDSLFRVIDLSLSTYNPRSLISRMNSNDSSAVADGHFKKVFNKAQEVSERTGGAFDITVAPVINAWGFGFTKKEKVDSAMIDSLLLLVGYKMVLLEGDALVKAKQGIMIDLNAIAQGYTVDVLAEFLESKGIDSYLVELGGEVRAKGKKPGNELWKIGIDQPNEEQSEGRPLKAIISLKDRSLATSGNYRKFYVEDGRKYSHIIDPHTGYPAKHNLLSATVIAGDCMTADAYATAFMVMGMEKAKQFLSENRDLDLQVFFIYDENGAWKTYASESLKEWIEEMP